MATTPERTSRSDSNPFVIAPDHTASPSRNLRIKKPPPITPRRFNRFFTPRDSGAGSRPARGQRKALGDLPDAAVNAREMNSLKTPPNKKRKLSFPSPTSISIAFPSSPIRAAGFLSSSQDHGLRSQDQESLLEEDEDDSEASTDIDQPRVSFSDKVTSYQMRGLASSLLHTRLGARPSRPTASGADLHLHETANFCSSSSDINRQSGRPPPVPFCAASCNTNPLVAVGDELGNIRLIDSANDVAHEFDMTTL
jgi:hypothetical protein